MGRVSLLNDGCRCAGATQRLSRGCHVGEPRRLPHRGMLGRARQRARAGRPRPRTSHPRQAGCSVRVATAGLADCHTGLATGRRATALPRQATGACWPRARARADRAGPRVAPAAGWQPWLHAVEGHRLAVERARPGRKREGTPALGLHACSLASRERG
jgi:hypothetical protein